MCRRRPGTYQAYSGNNSKNSQSRLSTAAMVGSSNNSDQSSCLGGPCPPFRKSPLGVFSGCTRGLPRTVFRQCGLNSKLDQPTVRIPIQTFRMQEPGSRDLMLPRSGSDKSTSGLGWMQERSLRKSSNRSFSASVEGRESLRLRGDPKNPAMGQASRHDANKFL